MTSTDTTIEAKLVPHGENLALVLDPKLLREIGIDENTIVTITTDRTSSIRIAAAIRTPAPEEVDAALKQVNREWGDVLKKLAE